jgi:hypothetical protein
MTTVCACANFVKYAHSTKGLRGRGIPAPSCTVRSESRCALTKGVLEVMSTSVYRGLNPFDFIRKHFLQIYVRKVAVHLQKVLEVMSTTVYTVLNQIYVP